MRALRQLVPVLLSVLICGSAFASVQGEHLALVAADQGLERWESAREDAAAEDPGPLLAGDGGRRNLAETNLNWAAALLRSGQRPDLAAQVIDAVLTHQDTAEASSTRGLFRWYADPVEPYSVDATIYLAPALAELASEMEGERGEALQASAALALEGLLSAAAPKGGFGTAMWAGAVAALGSSTGQQQGQQEAADAVGELLGRMRREGFGAIHSPTFDALRIGGLRWAYQHAGTEAARAQARTALELCYADMLQRYDPTTGMVAGAIGRAYPSEYLGGVSVAQYLLACDLPSALAQTRSVSPLAMYFALSSYALPAELLALGTEEHRPAEVRTRTPAGDREAAESTSTCTWVADGLSLGTMSGSVTGSSVPILATCDLPERPTSYVYPFGSAASLGSVQTGGLALCNFNFDAVGMGPRVQVGVSCLLGTRSQIKRVLIGRHDWIGEPEAVGQGVVVAVRRGSSYLGLKILDTGAQQATQTSVKPGGIAWFAEGNMDSLVLDVYGRRARYPLKKPLHDVKVGLLIEVAPDSQFASLEEFAEHVSSRRVRQSSSEKAVRTDEDDQRQIPGRHEIKSLGEMRFAKFLYHDMFLRSEALPLGFTEELLRNQVISRTLPIDLPEDYQGQSPGLTRQRGGEPIVGPQPSATEAEAAAAGEGGGTEQPGDETEDGAQAEGSDNTNDD